MTLGKKALCGVEVLFENCVWPTKKNKTPEELKHLKNIQLYCLDAIGFLRGVTSRDKRTGMLLTGADLIDRMTKHMRHALHNTAVDTYVFSLDLCRKRRPEKADTNNARERQQASSIKRGVSERLVLPPGRERYFSDEQILPGPMNAVFCTPEARIQLYEYITEMFLSESFKLSCVPSGKCVIVRGCIGSKEKALEAGLTEEKLEEAKVRPDKEHKCAHQRERYYLPPVEITGGAEEKPRFLTELLDLENSEADIDCYRWLLVYPHKNALVHSRDGDLLMIGLVQSRLWLRLDPNRKVFFQTRRSVGTQEPTREEAQVHRTKYERYKIALADKKTPQEANKLSDGVTTLKARARILWCERYYDLLALRTEIIKLVCENSSRPSSCPVEEWVVMMCLASPSHDYMKRKNFVHMIGDEYIMSCHLRRHAEWGSDLVKVWESEMQKPEDGRLPAHSLMYYDVDVSVLRKWATQCYVEHSDAKINPSKKNNTPAKLLKARRESSDKMIKKHLPTREQHEIAAAHICWVLQYYGNGPQYGVPIQLGTVVDDEGKSLYGYCAEGYVETKNIARSIIRRAPSTQ